jgi:hypothetical protein
MLRHQRKVGLIIIAAVMFGAGLAQAQPGGGGRGGRGGPGFGGGFGGMGMGGPGMGGIIGLAGNPAVHKEIGLEGEAVDKVQKIVTSFREDMMSAMQEAGFGGPGGGGPGGGPGQFQNLTPEERQAKTRELNEKRNEINKKLNEKFIPQLKEVLSDPQQERLREINWQVAGSQALAGPELGKTLELTKEQQEKITGINQDFGKKQQELGGAFVRGGGGGGPPDFEAMRERMQKVQALNKERDAKAIEVLTSEQQEKYAKLKGKPFDVAQLQMGPGGPGGRGGAFGGRGGPGGGRSGGPRGAAGRPQNKDDKKE